MDHSGPCLRLFAAPGGEDRRRLCGEATTHRLQALRLERCDPAFESFADLLEQDACGAFGRLVSTLGLVAGRPSDRRVRSSIATLNTDFGDREVAAHASAVGLSESRFRQIFRLETGVSFRRFRLAMRLCRALDLIDEGANLTLAAHESGFSSSAHFSAAFRAAYGVTPSLAARGMRLRRLGLDRMGRTSYASAQLSWRAA
ncbi:MAG: helix-turn-helix transcriptional regulator [Brevundimonas sp.]